MRARNRLLSVVTAPSSDTGADLEGDLSRAEFEPRAGPAVAVIDIDTPSGYFANKG